jgi:hypothetical protein
MKSLKGPRQKITARFRLRAADRSTHEAVMLQKQVATSADDRPEYVPGAEEYRLADGRPLNCIDERTFEVASTGERLTRLGPSIPEP